jgi:hypothetical protein
VRFWNDFSPHRIGRNDAKRLGNRAEGMKVQSRRRFVLPRKQCWTLPKLVTRTHPLLGPIRQKVGKAKRKTKINCLSLRSLVVEVVATNQISIDQRYLITVEQGSDIRGAKEAKMPKQKLGTGNKRAVLQRPGTSYTSPNAIKLQQRRAAALDYRLQGHPFWKIGKALNCHPSTAQSYVIRAMKDLALIEAAMPLPGCGDGLAVAK